MSKQEDLRIIYTKLQHMHSQSRDMLHQLREHHDLGIVEDIFDCLSTDISHITDIVWEELGK